MFETLSVVKKWQQNGKVGGRGFRMKAYVIHQLMGRPTVILQQIVVLGSRRCDNFLRYRLFTQWVQK